MTKSLNHDDYTIAWIAVLPIEAEAALGVLDKIHDGHFPSVRGDDYIYTGGELNGHNVVVATLPAGQNYGVGAAAALVNQVKARFANIWFALLVGVAAGLPNLSSADSVLPVRDIRLGDVLVCVPEKASSGIIHYDLGKDTETGFLTNGRQAEPPAIVRSAIGNIQLRKKKPFRAGNEFAQHLDVFRSTLDDDDKRFLCPSQDADRLFSWSHDPTAPPAQIQREARDESERTRVWYGNIGSGNSMMRNPRRRDELRDKYDLIGLEMEAAGVMNTLPTGVIRGVCDYGDGQKNKDWQPYAAAVAAVYAKGILSIISPRAVLSSQQAKIPDRDPLFTVPYSRDPRFTGRQMIMDRLAAGYAATNLMAVVGWAGVGKTQIAVEYCHRLRKQQPLTDIIWIRAGQRERFEQSYLDLGVRLQLPDWDDPDKDRMTLVFNWLSESKTRKWFMVVDNMDDETILHNGDKSDDPAAQVSGPTLASCLPIVEHGSILVTSRNRAAAYEIVREPSSMIDVPRMSEDEAIALLESKMPEDVSALEDKRRLVNELYLLPLAITQAASFISKNGFRDVARYLRLLELDKARYLEHVSPDMRRDFDGDVPSSVLHTWRISFEHIEARNHDAAELLCLVSVLQGQSIPVELLREQAGVTELEYFDVIRPLLQYSLITEEVDAESVSVHELVQISTRNWLENRSRLQLWKDQALELLYVKFPDLETSEWTLSEKLLPHVQIVVDYNYLENGRVEHLVYLLFETGRYIRFKGMYEKAREYFKRALKVCEDQLDSDYTHIATMSSFVALSELDLGNYDKAESFARNQFKTAISKYGPTHGSSPRFLEALANALARNGRYEEAAKWAKIFIENSTDSPKLLKHGKMILARVQRESGQCREAEIMLRDLYVDSLNSLGEEHLNTLHLAHELGETLLVLGEYKEATTLLQFAWTVRSERLGEFHADTLCSRGDFALCCKFAGDEELALSHCEIVASELSTRMGSNHPLVLKFRQNYAVMLVDAGKWHEGRRMLQEIYQALGLILHSLHPDLLLCSMSLASALSFCGQRVEGMALMQSVISDMNKALGEAHNFTLQASIRQSVNLYVLDRYLEAESVARHAMEVATKNYGPQHRLTMNASEALALACVNIGKQTEAQTLATGFIKVAEEEYGADSNMIVQLLSSYTRIMWTDLTLRATVEERYRTSIHRRWTKVGRHDGVTVDALSILAILIADQGRFHDAEQMVRDLVEDCTLKLGEGDSLTMAASTVLADLLARDDRPSMALAKNTPTAEGKIRQEVLVPDMSEDQLSKLYSRHRGKAEALSLRTRLHKLCQDLFGEDAERTLLSQGALANAFSSIGQYSQALAMHRDISIRRSKNGTASRLLTLQTSTSIANILRAQAKYEEAEVLYREVLSEVKTLAGTGALETMKLMNDIGLCLADRSMYAEAEEMDRELLALKQEILGSDHLETLLSCNNLAMDLTNQQKYTEAEDLMARVASGRTKQLGPNHLLTLHALSNVAWIARRRGEFPQNLALLQKAEDMDRQILGEREAMLGQFHQDVLHSMLNLCMDLTTKGNYVAAERLCMQLIDRRESTLEKTDPLLLSSYRLLIRIHRHQEKHAEVAQLAESVTQLHIEGLGRSNPETYRVLYETGHSMFMAGQQEAGEVRVRSAFDALMADSTISYFLKSDCQYNLTSIVEKRGDYTEIERLCVVLLEDDSPDPNDLKDTRFLRCRQAHALLKMGQARRAVDIMASIMTEEEEDDSKPLDVNSSTPGFYLNLIAQACFEVGTIELPVTNVLLKRRDVLVDSTNSHACEAVVNLGRLFLQLYHPEDEPTFRQAVKMASRIHGPESLRTHQIEAELGVCLYNRGRYTEALLIIAKNVREYVHRHGLAEDDLAVLGASNDWANCTAFCGDTAVAEERLSQVVTSANKKHGDGHFKVLIWRNNLGHVQYLNGNLQRSKTTLEAVLEHRAKTLGATDAGLLRSQYFLSLTLLSLGQLQQAHDLIRKTLAGYSASQKGLTKSTPALQAETLAAKTLFLKNPDEHGERARGMLTMTWEAQIRSLGETHPHTLATRLEIAKVMMHFGRGGTDKARALAMIQDVLKTFEITGLGRNFAAVEARAILDAQKGWWPWLTGRS